MGFKKERRDRMREQRALKRIRELSATLTEVTNAYEELATVNDRHVSGIAFQQTVNVVSHALLDAVADLGTIHKRETSPKSPKSPLSDPR